MREKKDTQDEKMWYSIKEALEYLNLDERAFSRKITGLNLETRTLPGEKGEFLSKRDLLLMERSIKGPGPIS